MSPVQILLIVLLLLLILGALPIFPWAAGFGYLPSGTLGIILLIILIVLLTRR